MTTNRRLSLRIGKSRVEIAPRDPSEHPSDYPSDYPSDSGVADSGVAPVPARTAGKTKPLGEMLIDKGMITQAQLDMAIGLQRERGGFLGRVLIELGYCRKEDITECLSTQDHVPYYNLNESEIDDAVLSLIPITTCKKFKLIPVDRLGDILTVAVLATFEEASLEAAQAACPNFTIKPIVCTYKQFASIIGRIEKKTKETGAQHVVTMESLGFHVMNDTLPVADFDSKQFDSKQQDSGQIDSGVFDSGDLALIIQNSMQKAIDELGAVIKQNTAAAPTQVAASGASIAEIQALVQAALAENKRQILEEMKAQAPVAVSAPAQSVDMDAIAEAVLKSIRPILETQQKSLDESAQAGRSPEAVVELNNIARGIQKEISTVMEEMMNSFSAQLKPMMTMLKSDDKFERQEQLVKSIYDNIKDTLLASQKDQGGYQAQLQRAMDAVRAAMQEVQQHAVQSAAQVAQIQGQLQEIGKGSETIAALDEIKTQLQDVDKDGETLNALSDIKMQLLQVNEIQTQVHALRGELALLATLREQFDSVSHSLLSLEDIRAQLAGGGGTQVDGVHALDNNDVRDKDEDVAVAEALSRNMDPSHFSFDTYQASETTVDTVKWCRHVAEKPGGGMAPLFLHGSPGTGKTHLVCATANEIRLKQAGLRVGYINAAEFAAVYLDMLQQFSLKDFHAHFSHWDVLILEDIQGLAHRPELQHELLQLLYVYTRSKRQLILTSTEPPSSLPGFDHRVQSHLSACTCMLVGPPNWQQRLAILKQENKIINAQLSDELLGLIAMNIPGNIRHLIGALYQAKAYAEQKNIKLSNEHADDLIKHIKQG